VFIQPKTEYLDKSVEKAKAGLTNHNLPYWSIPALWILISLPSIATSFLELPLAIVLLLSGGGFVGLLWIMYFRNNSSDGLGAERVVKAEASGVELRKSDTPQSHTYNLPDNLLSDQQIPQPQFASDMQEPSLESDRSPEAVQESDEVVFDSIDDSDGQETGENSEVEAEDISFYDELVDERDESGADESDRSTDEFSEIDAGIAESE
jgi:hypothetical protein